MVKLLKRERIEEFWDWFNSHKYYYEEIDNEWDPGFELLVEKLAMIDDNACIEAEIVNTVEGKHQIIISASGRIDYFRLVREVTDAAPEMIGWEAIAFVKPNPHNCTLEYKGYTIEISEMFFMPYLDKQQFNLMLHVKELGKIRQEDADLIARSVAIKTMGEYHFATKVTTCILEDYSEAVEEECLLPISQLHSFVVNNFMNSN